MAFLDNSGDIILDEILVTPTNLRSVRKRVGLIFQHFNLVGNLSSLNNVLSGLLGDNATVASLFFLFKKQLKKWSSNLSLLLSLLLTPSPG